MKKILLLCLVLVIAVVPVLGCQQDREGEMVLNILTWADYIPGDVLEDFTTRTGIEINFSEFMTNEEMLTKLDADKSGMYDIVIASDFIIDIARNKGLLAELDKAKIPNYGNISSAYQNQFYDPDNKHTIPYAAGTPLIVYDPAKVSFEITGYEDLWNPELADSVVLIDDMRVIIGITLKTLGYSFNTTNVAELEEAKQKLLELGPQVRAYDAETPHDKVISGECSVGFMFTSQVSMAKMARNDLVYVYPKEGLGWGIDSLFMPANAPHKNNAHAFLDFLLDPKIGARVSNYIQYLCCNEASKPYLTTEFLSNEVLYIPKEILVDTEFIMDVGDASSIYEQMWAELKQ